MLESYFIDECCIQAFKDRIIEYTDSVYKNDLKKLFDHYITNAPMKLKVSIDKCPKCNCTSIGVITTEGINLGSAEHLTSKAFLADGIKLVCKNCGENIFLNQAFGTKWVNTELLENVFPIVKIPHEVIDLIEDKEE